MAEQWLRRKYRCGIVLSEQCCASGETPDVIGWKNTCRSVLIECKISRSDFLADREKPWRKQPENGTGCERLYLAPHGLIRPEELPKAWGLLECKNREITLTVKPRRQSLITDFLKWKNRLTEYNGGTLPQGVTAPEAESNVHLKDLVIV